MEQIENHEDGDCGKDHGDKGGDVIVIDREPYRVFKDELTGAQIREVAKPPIGPDRDLWLDIVDELDELVEDDEVVNIRKGLRFFSVPREINPG